MELGFKDNEFYVKKSIAPQEICYNSPVVHKKPLGAHICEMGLLVHHTFFKSNNLIKMER